MLQLSRDQLLVIATMIRQIGDVEAESNEMVDEAYNAVSIAGPVPIEDASGEPIGHLAYDKNYEEYVFVGRA